MSENTNAIPISELRQGINLLCDGKIREVSHFVLPEKGFADQCMVYFSGPEKYSALLSCCTPIELTEEVLKLIGFDNKGYSNGYIGIDIPGPVTTDFVLTYPDPPTGFHKHFYWGFTYGGWPRFLKFPYLHDLQNTLYFLTGGKLCLKYPCK